MPQSPRHGTTVPCTPAARVRPVDRRAVACLLGMAALLCPACQRAAPPPQQAAAAPTRSVGLTKGAPPRAQPAYAQPAQPEYAFTPATYTPPPTATTPPRPATGGTTGAFVGLNGASETIMPGDVIQVEVEGQPKYSGQVQVSGTGAPFYNLGLVTGIAGRGTAQLAEDLTRRYRERDLRDPKITVVIREHAPRRIYVAGCVQKPGVIPLTFGTTTTVMRAIAEAGGFSDDANRQAIVILRDGRQVQLAGEAMILRDPSRDLPLRADDQIVIPPIDRIYVSGEVMRGGPVVPPPNEQLTVSRVLSMAGGLGRYASHDLLLMRGNERIGIDLDAVLSGQVADPGLRPGDALFVPQRRF